MADTNSYRFRDTVLTLAGILLLLGCARYASDIVVPFLLALFIAIIAATPVNYLKQRGVPKILSIGLVLLAVLMLFGLISLMLGSTMQQFNQALPDYQVRLNEIMTGIVNFLSAKGLDVQSSGLREALDPGIAMSFANTLFIGLADTLSNTLLILFTTMFVLFDFLDFPKKFQAVEGSESERVLEKLALLVKSTNEYTIIKAIVSLGTGALIWLCLVLVGLDFAILWGVLAFILNFIPNIGSLLAAVPAVLLALIQLGPVGGLIVVAVYGSVNLIMGNIVEPKIMGKRLGLSTLTVFLSLVFWGWLFGPVGMLLSVPLTMAVKFAAMSNTQTIWFGVLLSPVPEHPIVSQTAHNRASSINLVDNNKNLKQELDELRRELEILKTKQGHYPEESNKSLPNKQN